MKKSDGIILLERLICDCLMVLEIKWIVLWMWSFYIRFMVRSAVTMQVPMTRVAACAFGVVEMEQPAA